MADLLAGDWLDCTMTQSLIQKLRDAESGSRELDRELWEHFGFETVSLGSTPNGDRFLVKPEPGRPTRPRMQALTTSLDAIIGLIEEKLKHQSPAIQVEISYAKCRVEVRAFTACNWKKDSHYAWHKDKCLAACLALLPALGGES